MTLHIPVVTVVVSITLMIVSIPMIMRKVPKNNFYGFRTRQTLSGTDENWYKANRSAGIGMFVAGLASFVSCFLVPLFTSNNQRVLLVCTAILVAGVLLATALAFVQQGKP